MKVLVADRIANEGIDILKSHGEVDVKTGLKPDQLIAIIGEYDALVVRSETRVTKQVIEAGKKLRVIARAGVGVDNIDVDAATRNGIVVVNAPTGNTIAAAEHTLAMMLALARSIPQAHSTLRAGKWLRNDFVGVELRNKVLGILGLGHVGSEVARRVQGFELRVVGYDPFVTAQYARNLGVELLPLEDILKTADFITLHLPLTSQTKDLIGRKELAMMKPTARIINCARGGLIDETALCEAVSGGRLAGAAVDVFSQEPATDNPLCQNEKIIVTPHLGASTVEAQTGVAIDAAEQVVAVLDGQAPRYAVNAPFVPPETMGAVAPYMKLAIMLGRLVSQLAEGQMSSLDITYEGDAAAFDGGALKAATLSGLLQSVTEERINLVNAGLVAQGRGLHVAEHKNAESHAYGNLVTVTVSTSKGQTSVAASLLRGEPHIMKVNEHWIDLKLEEGYFFFADHRDRPGLIGAVGNITGKADINISYMQLSRLEPRGKALMVLALDAPLNEDQRRQVLSLPDVYTAKMVKL